MFILVFAVYRSRVLKIIIIVLMVVLMVVLVIVLALQRAYTLIFLAGTSHMEGRERPDNPLPTTRDLSMLFEIICEPGDVPKFVTQGLEKQAARSRANTITSISH